MTTRPVSQRIADDLRRDIQSGRLRPGAILPSERELIGQYRTTKSSVSKAVAALRSEGLLTSQPGRGVFVRTTRQRVRRHHSERYQWEKDRVNLPDGEREKSGATEYDTGLEMTNLDFRARYSTVDAPEELADRFGVASGTRLLQREYWTSSHAEHSPLNLVRSYLLYAMVAANPDLLNQENEPWPGGTQHQLSTIGVELDRIVDQITARPPLPEEMETLDIEPGVSVLELHKISIDTVGRVVEISDVVMPGDRT